MAINMIEKCKRICTKSLSKYGWC